MTISGGQTSSARRSARRWLGALAAASALLLVSTGAADAAGTVLPRSAVVHTVARDLDTLAPRTATCSTTVLVNCTRRIEFPVGATTRTAYVYLPPQAAVRAVPMVVVVHGLRQSPRIIDDMSGWTTLARRGGIALTFPLGYWTQPEKYGFQTSWNAGSCCGPASERWDDVDDLATMDAVVPAAQAVYPSNGRVYYAGFSNGAMLGYRLQCEDRGPFRAFVAVDGEVAVPSCRPSAPRPFLAIHALKDAIVPYAGCTSRQAGTSCRRTRLNADLTPARATIQGLRAASGCTGVRTRRYAPHMTIATPIGCTKVGPVHMTQDNAGHLWLTDKRRYGVNETELAWQFLRTK